jgi:hypothetical protein
VYAPALEIPRALATSSAQREKGSSLVVLYFVFIKYFFQYLFLSQVSNNQMNPPFQGS